VGDRIPTLTPHVGHITCNRVGYVLYCNMARGRERCSPSDTLTQSATILVHPIGSDVARKRESCRSVVKCRDSRAVCEIASVIAAE
jgi:hypothetical protein